MNTFKTIVLLVLVALIAVGCTIEKQKDGKKDQSKVSKYNPNAEVAEDFGIEGQMVVTLADTNKLSLIDLSNFKVGDTVDVGVNPQDVTFTRDGKLYFAVMTGIWKNGGGTPLEEEMSLTYDSVWTWDTSGHRIVGKASTSKSDDRVRPVGVAVNKASDRVLIANMSSDELLIKDIGESSEEIARVKVGFGPRRILVTPDDKYAITINTDLEDRSEKDSVSIVHLLSFAEEARVEVGPYPWAGAICSDSKNFYVSISGADEIVKINIDKREVVDTFKIGKSPRGIALSTDGKTLYVASHDEDLAIPFNLENKTAGQGFSTGKGPQELAIAKSDMLLFVANNEGKSISVINITQEKLIETIRVDGSPSAISIYIGAPPQPSSAGRYMPPAEAKRPIPESVKKVEPGKVEPSKQKGK